MSEILATINTYGPLATSILCVGYMFMVKINHIDEIKVTLDKMDKTIEKKLDMISQRQIDHEGRISHIEGSLNGRHKTVG